MSASDVNEQFSPQLDAEEKSESSPPALSSDIANPLIDFTKNLPEAVSVEVPEINIAPLPTTKPPAPNPQSQVHTQQQPARHEKRVKLSLYLNGKLSENRSEHSTAGEIIFSDDCTSWQHNDNGDYLFPDDWTARLHIENFTGKDLLNPKVTVNFARGKYSFDIPNVNSGQTRDVDIPIAGRVAVKSNLHGTFSVAVKSSSSEPIPLLVRYLKSRQ